MLTSEIDRLTIWPVCSSSCRAPSSRDSAPSISVRRSCCTSRESRPPGSGAGTWRRSSSPRRPAARSRAARSERECFTITSSMICRWISGMIAVTTVATSAPPRARVKMRAVTPAVGRQPTEPSCSPPETPTRRRGSTVAPMPGAWPRSPPTDSASRPSTCSSAPRDSSVTSCRWNRSSRASPRSAPISTARPRRPTRSSPPTRCARRRSPRCSVPRGSSAGWPRARRC